MNRKGLLSRVNSGLTIRAQHQLIRGGTGRCRAGSRRNKAGGVTPAGFFLGARRGERKIAPSDVTPSSAIARVEKVLQ
jgi:hypothetical protein